MRSSAPARSTLTGRLVASSDISIRGCQPIGLDTLVRKLREVLDWRGRTPLVEAAR